MLLFEFFHRVQLKPLLLLKFFPPDRDSSAGGLSWTSPPVSSVGQAAGSSPSLPLTPISSSPDNSWDT